MPNKKISELSDAGTISTSDEIPLARAGRTYKAKIGLSIVPAGCVMAFAGSTIPEGWLLCDGSAIPNTTGSVQGKTANFSTLFSIVGGTVPDLRGVFIRGVDNNRGVDVGRGIRSYQDDMIKSHNHALGNNGRSNEPATATKQGIEINNKTTKQYNINNESFGGTETRPKNVALHYIIKY
jgi:microcystin-dependent protein